MFKYLKPERHPFVPDRFVCGQGFRLHSFSFQWALICLCPCIGSDSVDQGCWLAWPTKISDACMHRLRSILGIWRVDEALSGCFTSQNTLLSKSLTCLAVITCPRQSSQIKPTELLALFTSHLDHYFNWQQSNSSKTLQVAKLIALTNYLVLVELPSRVRGRPRQDHKLNSTFLTWSLVVFINTSQGDVCFWSNSRALK